MDSPPVSPQRRENLDLIHRFYDARAAWDLDGVRQMLDPDVAWHDPYPPPHGGDIRGAEAVILDVFLAAGGLTGGTTTLRLRDAIASDVLVAALVDWSTVFRDRSMEGTEAAVFRVRDRRIVEAWFHPEDQHTTDEFFR